MKHGVICLRRTDDCPTVWHGLMHRSAQRVLADIFTPRHCSINKSGNVSPLFRTCYRKWLNNNGCNNGFTINVAQESISNLIKSISSLLLTRSPEPRSDHIQINKISLNKEAQMDYYPFSVIVLKVIRVLQDRRCVK